MKAKPLPRIETVPAVTMEHGETFAYAWFQGNISDAVDDTEVLTWPGGGLEYGDAHSRYHNLSDEIATMVFAETRQEIAEAFVRIANAVIHRERRYAATERRAAAKRGDE
jgi:hypothetical protein